MFFFQNVLNLMHISEMQETIQKMSFVFEVWRFNFLREIQHVTT